MENEGSVAEASCWTSFHLSIPSGEESEVMEQLFIQREESSNVQPNFEADHSTYYCSNSVNISSYLPRSSEYNTSDYSSVNTDIEHCYLSEYTNAVHAISVDSESIEFSLDEEQNISPFFADNHYHCQFSLPLCMNDDTISDEVEDSTEKQAVAFLHNNHNAHATKRRIQIADLDTPLESPNKRGRASNLVVSKRGKNGQGRLKAQKIEEEGKADLISQSSSSYSSADDESMNASQEPNGCTIVTSSKSKRGSTVNQNGKSRASRGSATDPQSLYARKRRERINERLRILQNLVPNGTKVDISTMLEEAVQYVKFLQLQIKLLSSDELWMYAPIAYNGMNIGLDLKISQAS